MVRYRIWIPRQGGRQRAAARFWQGGGRHSAAFATAQRAFLHSLAAYSVVCYVLAIKDRHNGNLLLHRNGHLVHIDFGFVLGKAPGGAVSLEAGVPFKLTKEMVDVLGGPTDPLYTETFVDLCTLAFEALRPHAETLLTLIEISAFRPSIPCFDGESAPRQMAAVRERMLLDVPVHELRGRVQQLIDASYSSRWTRMYDDFQKMSNGIMP